jgi:hypothetical protein
MLGNPKKRDISTSFVERDNLTMRLFMRRFTRLTNAFSKRIDNHVHALSIYFVWFNFVRQQKTSALARYGGGDRGPALVNGRYRRAR